MRKVMIYLTAVLFIAASTPAAQAGLLDKINAATKKLEQKNQEMQQKSTPDWRAGASDRNPDGTCKHRSAVCMDYNVTVDKCLAPLNGYRAKITAELIENKLKTEPLSVDLRKNLEEDLAALREAEKNQTDLVTIAGEKNSHRHLMDISQDDQVAINSKFGVKYQEITNKCMGADHMGVGHRTEMNYVQDNSASMAESKKQDKMMNDSMSCLTKISGLRWKIMADIMEEKMNQTNPAGKARAEWEGDIASLRAAYDQGLPMPNPVDLENPSRYMTRLSMDDQMKLNTEYSKKSQDEIAKCSAMAGDGKIKEREIKSGGLVDQSKSPANRNAKPEPKDKNAKKGIQVKQTNALSCALGACGNLDGLSDMTSCQKEIGGYRWMVMAEKMQAKFNTLKPKLSGDEIKSWREDISAVREAETNMSAKVTSPDPADEYRYQDRLSREEQQATNQEYVKLYNARMKYCNDHFSKMTDHN